MKVFFSFFGKAIFLFPIFIWGQTKVLIFSTENDNPIENVSAFNEENQLVGKTNKKGEILIQKPGNYVLYADGYWEQYIEIKENESKKMIYLDADQSLTIGTVELFYDDDEARKLVKRVINNRKINHPKNLESYRYDEYLKLIITANPDSIKAIRFARDKEDSTHNQYQKLIQESHLFLMERAAEQLYSKRFGQKHKVLAQRLSGLENFPLYEVAAIDPISDRLDEEKFNFFFSQLINPVSRTGLNHFNYRLKDTIQAPSGPQIELSFGPKDKDRNDSKIKGVLHIEEKTAAVTYLYAEHIEKGDSIHLRVFWDKKKGYWFPREKHFQSPTGQWHYAEDKDSIDEKGTHHIDTIQRKVPIWMYYKQDYFNLKIPIPSIDKNDFKGYSQEIAPDAFDNWEAVLPRYRTEALDERAANTYEKIDSVGQEENILQMAKLLRVFSRGGILEVGKVDLDLSKILAYNDYEGLRLGFGAATNYKFHPKLSFNGYFAYGFKDARWKGGVGTQWIVNEPVTGFLFANAVWDISPSGRTDLVLQNNLTRYMDGTLGNIYNNQFYSYENFQVGYQQDVFNNVSLRFSANKENQLSRFDYTYLNEITPMEHQRFYGNVAIRWSPGDEFMRVPYGKITTKTGNTAFYVNISKDFETLDGQFDFFKADFTLYHTHFSSLGSTNFTFRTGKVWGETPLFNLFEGLGNRLNGDDIWERFGVAGKSMFETMPIGQFYADEYLSFHTRHRFKSFKFLKTYVSPQIVYRAAIGNLSNPENHQLNHLQTFDNWYQEVGLEFNNLFSGLGLGGYYVLGNYQQGDFKQDFNLKLTFDLLF